MKEILLENTIVAISTPPGQGAMSIIRLSGNQSINIVKKIFKSKRDLEKIAPWHAVLGKIYDGSTEVDEVVVIKFMSPKSYTKENMVEVTCHGGMYVRQRIIELIIENGARVAQPGEFTLRAFLNGRLDLSQAEAIADLIQAQTESSLQTSLNQLQGKLAERIREIRDLLLDSCSLLELELDFADENLEFVNRQDFIKQLKKIQNELDDLISTYRIGRIAREGVKLVIVGKPNVGKSSLLNVLSKEERAIVTEIPGTTRDALEVRLDLQGILFRMFDTAGIAATNNPIEQEGVRRAEKHLFSADIVVHLFDGSQPLDEEDYSIMKKINALKNKNIIRVINKSDLQENINKYELFANSIKILSISALKNIGIKELEKEIIGLVTDNDKIFSDETMITNARHWEALKGASSSLNETKQEAEKGVSSEFISVYLRDALDSLGQIIGTVTSEDILNNIFSKFCIGK